MKSLTLLLTLLIAGLISCQHMHSYLFTAQDGLKYWDVVCDAKAPPHNCLREFEHHCGAGTMKVESASPNMFDANIGLDAKSVKELEQFPPLAAGLSHFRARCVYPEQLSGP